MKGVERAGAALRALTLVAIALAPFVACDQSSPLVSVDVTRDLPAEEEPPQDSGITVPPAPTPPSLPPQFILPPVPGPGEAGSDAGAADADVLDSGSDPDSDSDADSGAEAEAQPTPPPIAQAGGVAVGGGCYSLEGDWCEQGGDASLVGLDRPLVCLNPTGSALAGCESVPVPATGALAGYAFSYWCCTPLPEDAGTD
jgi:hypothetical protein